MYAPTNITAKNKKVKNAIVAIRLHWFDVVARLQDTHWGDPVVALLDDIPSLP